MTSKKTKIVLKTKERLCSICGKQLIITIYEDHSYSGGNCFGSLEGKKKGEKVEYWECDQCYKE